MPIDGQKPKVNIDKLKDLDVYIHIHTFVYIPNICKFVDTCINQNADGPSMGKIYNVDMTKYIYTCLQIH